MIVDLKGTIKVIFPEKKIADNFTALDFVILIDEKSDYPQELIIQVSNQKIALLKGYKKGDNIFIKCNLRGKEQNGKYFNKLSMFEIKNINKYLDRG